MMQSIFLGTVPTMKRFGVSRATLRKLRSSHNGATPSLTEGVHWFRCGCEARFNVSLVEDFFVNQTRPEAHKRAIDTYLNSLPSASYAA